MLSITSVSAEQVKDYFEHSEDYYTQHLTNYDKWHGTLANTIGAVGEVSKEQFDNVLSFLSSEKKDGGLGRSSKIGVDCTFSAPKSISLALAYSPEIKEQLIKLHQDSVNEVLQEIEMEHIQTKHHDQVKFKTRNMAAAEFVHFTNRNNELDLHSHTVIFNMTMADGKLMATDTDSLMNSKMLLGLKYRTKLAKKLQEAGYKLEVTDARQGFFELKGFDRETVMEYSTRRQEILAAAEKHGLTGSSIGMQAATLNTRKTKDKEQNITQILNDTNEGLYKSGRIDLKGVIPDGTESFEDTREIREASPEDRRQRIADDSRVVEKGSRARQSFACYAPSFQPQGIGEITREFKLQNLQDLNMDIQQRKSNLLLSDIPIRSLAKLQSKAVTDYYMRQLQSKERERLVKEYAAETLKQLSAEKFAFSVKETKYRIMANGVLEGITEQEAEKAIEHLAIIKLGKMDGDMKNVYLTTQKNIDKEKSIIDKMKQGKGKIQSLSMEESVKLLAKVEAETNLTPNTEQTAAIHHILTSADRYLGVQGLAGVGKTYLMKTVKEVCDRENITIKGICYTGKAADGLASDSGIESSTIHSFLNKLEGKRNTATSQDGIKQEWDFSNVNKAQGREIWIVDEAGLVDNNLMIELQKAAEARGAQVVLSGDYSQLPPVGAGQPMRQMIEAKMGTAYLEDIRRQKNRELLEAVKESVSGDHLKTFQKLGDNYREIKDRSKIRQEIEENICNRRLDDYIVIKQNGERELSQLLLVSTNSDRKTYNREIRKAYVDDGQLESGKRYKISVHSGNKNTIENRNFAKNDRIIFTQNDKRLGVMNGTMGRIDSIQGNIFSVTTDAGQKVSFDIEQYNSIDYSYSVTNYKAQGMTVHNVYVDMNTSGAAQSRNALYVDISRAKYNAIVYTDDKKKLEKQTRQFAHKITSKDFQRRIDQMERAGVQNNDRYHAPKRKTAEQVLAEIAKHDKEASQLPQRPRRVLEYEKEMEHHIVATIPLPKEQEVPPPSKARTITTEEHKPPKKQKLEIKRPVERDTGFHR